MIVLDASVLIALLHSDDPHHVTAMALIAAADEIELASSVIATSESLVRATMLRMEDSAYQLFDALAIQVLSLTSEAVPALVDIRASTRLAMPDCSTLLAAEELGAALATFDHTLAGKARSRGLRVIAA